MSSSTPQKDEPYEQTAKKQIRDYQKWRKHFTWRKDQVVATLRDYSLWSLLALLAYYNMYKREELAEYDARTFVMMDKLEEQIHKINPHSRLLLGTIYEPDAAECPATSNASSVDGKNPPIFF
ncbi:hypothetical protein IWW36_000481 [Coemansia brasiliensis]|uniref:Uncharacterized protein n=1 Tax=Coemansia brasiliensis TaxID=2650707 RepID=A0A9W8IJV2_9FUNG|nr:hypothetical protein IWW36_000481 [Coemansia brasiliensis]